MECSSKPRAHIASLSWVCGQVARRTVSALVSGQVRLLYVLGRSAMLPAASRLAWLAMTARMGISVKGLTGRWRIVEMDNWDRDAVDLVGPGFVEFSWEGVDEGDQVSGRGWAALAEDGGLTGHLYFHLGDDSGFRATPLGDGR